MRRSGLLLSGAGGSLASLFEVHVRGDVTVGGIIAFFTMLLQAWIVWTDSRKKKRKVAEYYLSDLIGKTLKINGQPVPVYTRASLSPGQAIGTLKGVTSKVFSWVSAEKAGTPYHWLQVDFKNGVYDTAFIPFISDWYELPAGMRTAVEADAKRAEIDSAYAESQQPTELEKWGWRALYVAIGLGVAKIAASSIVQYFKK